jgi:hypothetical protein
MRSRLWSVPVLAFALAVVGGCSNEPRVYSVSGTATRGGKPVPSLLIQFQPASGRPSWGITDAQGKFTLEYTEKIKGAVAGNHAVTAVFRAMTPDEEMKGAGNNKLYGEIAGKYGDVSRTPMKIDITKSESNLELKFD